MYKKRRVTMSPGPAILSKRAEGKGLPLLLSVPGGRVWGGQWLGQTSGHEAARSQAGGGV